MAKSNSDTKKQSSKKENSTTARSKTAFATKDNTGVSPSGLNRSKYASTDAVNTDVDMYDPAEGLEALFYEGIKGLYWSERHLTDALPKMAAAAGSAALQKAITNHLAETETHVDRLLQVFELLGKQAKAKKCAAMEGLTIDGEAVIENTDAGSSARDLGIIMASSKVEHYEIAAYTGLVNLANKLGLSDIAALLEETLKEEQASADILADIAATDEEVNQDIDNGQQA